MSAKKQPAAPKQELPPNVRVSDLKWPETGKSVYDKLRELGIDQNSITFYKTSGFGWVVTTLSISNSKRRSSERTYGISVDGKVCRVGSGPHVKEQVTVYLSTDNWERLLPYVELYLKGLEQAGTIRDRISSRRAQGQINRANGLNSWRW